MNIIGVNGFKRSGKGETGKAIADLLGPDTKLLGFADKLKIFAARSLGYTAHSDQLCIDLMDAAKEEWAFDVWTFDVFRRIRSDLVTNLTMRQYLQNVGNEARTVFGEDFWVDQVLPRPTPHIPGSQSWLKKILSTMYPGYSTLVFTDLRYENEAQRIIDLGGFNIQVVRSGVVSDGHVSEQPLPEHLVEYQLVNDYSLDHLKWKANQMLEATGLMS